MHMESDEVLCECPIEKLVLFISIIESKLSIELVIPPKLGMTMVKAQDSIDFQSFYLGEVLITECQLTVDGQLGYGFCMGDQGKRAYSIAIIDAIIHSPLHPLQNEIFDFIKEQGEMLELEKLKEYNQILKTKVDFKIMEQD